jgi:gliding motility-associated-like protein
LWVKPVLNNYWFKSNFFNIKVIHMRRQLPILIFLLLFCVTLTKAQSTYRSLGTGVTVDLGLAANWQTSPDGGTTWVTAAAPPTALASGSTITIQAGDTWQNSFGATTIPTGVTLINNSVALGTFTAAKLTCTGTLVYSGTAAQTLPASASFAGSAITNITINNTAGVTTSGTLNILGVINLIAGTFSCNGGGGSLYYKGSITGSNGLLNVAGNFFTQAAVSGQVIPGNLLVNTTINKLNVATVNSGINNYSSSGPIKISSGIGLYAGVFTLGGTLTVTGSTITAATGAGGVTAGSNMVTFSGTAAQAIPAAFFTGNSVNNLTIGNSATGVTSAGPLNIGSSYTVTPLKAGIVPLTVTGTATIGGDVTISSFVATPTVGQQYTILSATAVSGTFAGGLTLPAGYMGTLAYTATAVTLTVYPSTDATLSALSLSTGTLAPVFASGTNSYTVSVPNATATINITPTANDATATIKVNGTTVASGAASAAIPLSIGSNTITTIVTAHDGVTTQTYTVTVTRTPLSTDATLSALALSNGTLSPAFASGTNTYTASVANAISSITVTPTVNYAAATVTVNGVTTASGAASAAIPLTVGSNTITTVVTAEDGTTTQTYTVNLTRTPLSTDATLSALALSTGSLSPVFASGTITYTASVNNATNSITVTPTVNDATATVTVNGTAVASGAASAAIALTVGSSNIITTAVTAQDGTLKTYTLTVTRAASSNADLANFTISSGILAPAFATATTAYTTTVGSGVASITVTPTVSDATATVTVNGTVVTSGSASGAVALSIGTNTITTIVTAQDGTLKTYALTVTKTALSSNAALSGLTLSAGTLNPAFASGTTTYSASVTSGVSSITVTPTLSDATATITVNGTAVVSGSASAAQALTVGSNTITIAVTAQDGITVNTYTVNVTRPGLPQTITFAPLSSISYGSADVTPAASSTNNSIAITYSSSNTAVATITGTGTIHITGAGSTTITASQNGNTTYSPATPVPQTLVVNPAVLTATANNQSKVYGAALPAFTISYSGFVNDDTQSAITTLAIATTAATTASAVGNNYSITASGASASNYTFSYVDGTLAVTPAPLIITASSPTKVYGAALPTLTASYAGFVNNDTFASLTTLPTVITTATSASAVGPYAVTASGAASSNYNISYVAGSLTVTAAPLTIAANPATVVYGSVAPALTATYTGFVNGDDATKLTTQPVLSTTYTTASAATTYPITASGAASGNYNITYTAGTLTVTKAVLTVTANNASKVYGSANPALSVTYSGFLNGDGTAQLTTQPAVTTTATTTSVAGTYPITASGGAATNYSFNYVAGVLSVTPATRIFAFGPIPAHTFGDTDFSPGATVNTGETITYTTSDPTIATIANGLVHIVSAGSVTITASIASNPSYADVQPISQAYVINKAAQTISFNSLPVLQVGGPVLSLSLVSSAGLPVTLSSSDQTIASVNAGQHITALSVGSVIITATQAGNNDYLPATYSQLLKVEDAVELVKVRPGLSPNGDGINDFLVIEGIQDYPDNKLTIVNRNGSRVFQSSGYNNLTNVFDGHSGNNGELMAAGTYFYELEIKVNGETKRKAGYIVLKFN